jgi:hypothetical protein
VRREHPHHVLRAPAVNRGQHLAGTQVLLVRPATPRPLHHPHRIDQHSVEVEQDGGGGRLRWQVTAVTIAPQVSGPGCWRPSADPRPADPCQLAGELATVPGWAAVTDQQAWSRTGLKASGVVTQAAWSAATSCTVAPGMARAILS